MRVQIGSCYVAFSTGKDSSVIAHAVHARYPDVPILMVDSDNPYRWTKADAEKWTAYIERMKWNFTAFKWAKSKVVAGKLDKLHASMFAELQEHAEARGWTQRIMGMRQEESHSRAMLVATKGDEYDYVDGGSALLPIARWTTNDVWAYIVTNDIPWLTVYDWFGPDARSGIVGKNAVQYGRIARLREYDVDAYLFARENIPYADQFS